MSGHFANYDEGKCRHYAAFASHLGREAFDVLYWCLFVFVIFCLFLSGYIFDKYVRIHLRKRQRHFLSIKIRKQVESPDN